MGPSIRGIVPSALPNEALRLLPPRLQPCPTFQRHQNERPWSLWAQDGPGLPSLNPWTRKSSKSSSYRPRRPHRTRRCLRVRHVACTISGEFWTNRTPMHPFRSLLNLLIEDSVVESPIRHQTRNIRYIKSRVENVSFDGKTCRCSPAVAEASKAMPKEFTLAYDYLILAPGCTNNTFGTPGVAENAFFVRTANDAKAIQAHIRNCFEMASIPGTSNEDSKSTSTLYPSGPDERKNERRRGSPY